jgi:predicted ester cyclase
VRGSGRSPGALALGECAELAAQGARFDASSLSTNPTLLVTPSPFDPGIGWDEATRCSISRAEGQQREKEFPMSKEQENKAVVGRWFKEFWGNPWNPGVVDELSTPDILLQYSLHAPRRGREDVKKFMTEFRRAFPDLKFWGAADLIAEGDYVVGRWEGGGTHTGPAFSDFLIGSLPAASGRKMRFTGTTVLRVKDGKIAEEIGLDDGATALQQLGILRAA